MKLLFLTASLLFIVADTNNKVEAGLIKNIFTSVHDTAHKVREDIHDAIIPNHPTAAPESTTNKYEDLTTKKSNEDTTSDKVPEKIVTTTSSDDKALKIEDATTQKSDEVPNVTNKKEDSKKSTEKEAGDKTNKASHVESEVKSVEVTTHASVQATTVKDGRNVFDSNCKAGYVRSSGGSCVSTY